MKYKTLIAITWVTTIIAIILFSLLPNLAPPSANNIDKYLHFLAYMTVSTFPIILFKTKTKIFFATSLILTIAISLEFIQDHVVGREFSYGDIVANLTGVVVGMVIGLILTKIVSKINRNEG